MALIQSRSTQSLNRVVFTRITVKDYDSGKIVGFDYELDHVPVSSGIYYVALQQAEECECAANGCEVYA